MKPNSPKLASLTKRSDTPVVFIFVCVRVRVRVPVRVYVCVNFA